MIEGITKKGGRPPTILYANYHVRMGPKNQAFRWLGKRIDEADPGILQYKIDPVYDRSATTRALPSCWGVSASRLNVAASPKGAPAGTIRV